MSFSECLSDSNGAKTNEEAKWRTYLFCVSFLYVCIVFVYGLSELYFYGHSEQQYKHVIYNHINGLSGFTTATFQMNPSELQRKTTTL